MANNTPQDRQVELIKERLQHDLVDDQGNVVDPDDVAQVVDASAASLADAPIQQFTALLIEHDARDALREHGFHLDMGDEDDVAPAHDSVGQDESPTIHLAAQQGLASPEPD